MEKIIPGGSRKGHVNIPSSKSMAHRMYIVSALGKKEVKINCRGISKDIMATIECLRALENDPKRSDKDGYTELFCNESGSTLRFLLPIVGALGKKVVFRMKGRLPERPLEPLKSVLSEKGMLIQKEKDSLYVSGRLENGEFIIPGDVSSQYISGLLMALPLLEEDSVLKVTGKTESSSYIEMTEQVLFSSGAVFEKSIGEDITYRIKGGCKFDPPEEQFVEGDYSNAAFFLCMGALSHEGISVSGLDNNSVQGDRKILELLEYLGAHVIVEDDKITVKRKSDPLLSEQNEETKTDSCAEKAGETSEHVIDASEIPDLVPVLSVVCALTPGSTRIINAGRLRLKESDRLSSTAELIGKLGGIIEISGDTLVIEGVPLFRPGIIDPHNDHRIAMAAAVAACGVKNMKQNTTDQDNNVIIVECAQCVEKSYPKFWDDFDDLVQEEIG